MKIIHCIFNIFILIFCSQLIAADIDNGEHLHMENCTGCHQDNVYLRDNRKIKTLDQLKKQVQQCELALELAWFEEEIEDVTTYLNTRYYLFGIN